MKKLLLYLLLFVPFISIAQTKLDTVQIDLASVQAVSTAVIRVNTTSAMQSYAGKARVINVTATDGTGGLFTYVTSGLTNDGGVVFTATGIGSGFWKRQFNPADGVKIAWWGDNDTGIDAAITFAGVNGKIQFTPNKTYLQSKTHTPLAGQIWVGNNATLQRQTETVVTTTASFASTVSVITVSSVPSTWHVGSQIQIFLSQSSIGASQLVTISGISGTTITLASVLSTGLYNSATSYASGSSVWKVWNQVDDATAVNNNVEIDNLNFDGNQTTSCPNVYWGANIAFYARAPLVKIFGCSFLNMGNDCISGHGLNIQNCYFNNLNNSGVHLSADFTVTPATYPSYINNNYFLNTNQILSTSGSQHSEGVITLSFTSGYCFIDHNWFKGGLDAVLGTISMGTVSQSGATRFMRFDHNQCFNFSGIIKGFSADNTETIKPGYITIDNNNFDNCGTTAPFPATLNAQWAFIDKIVWFNNTLSGGTTITIPAEVYTADAIANVGSTGNVQTGAAINVDGFIKTASTGTFGDNVAIGGTSTSISFGVRKSITGGTTAYAIRNDGAIQSGVTSSAFMNYTSPSTVASLTFGQLYHYFANGVTLGSGSALTNQYGYYAQSNLTAATNNYGFYSNLAAGTNVWAFYGSGTAASLFGGPVTFKQPIVSVNASATLTAAQVQTGIKTSSTSSVAFTMPTSTLLATQVGAAQGTTIFFTIDNSASTSSGAITLILGTGMTSGLNAGLTIPIGKAQTYEVYFTSTTTCVMSQIL